MTKKIEQVKEDLNKNPIFHLSLSSKELFHSNFLYWLQKAVPEKTSNFFKKYLESSPEVGDIKCSAREENNFDLVFKWDYIGDNKGKKAPSYKHKLIIENKVKSLPYIGQLKKYQEKAHSNSSFLLLTLGEDNLPKKNGKVSGTSWQVLRYKDLKSGLIDDIKKEDIHVRAGDPDTSHKIIQQYGEFLEGLTSIVNKVEVNPSDQKLIDKKVQTTLSELRIQDLYQKRRFEGLLNLIRDSIRDEKLISKEEYRPENGSTPKGKIYLERGFTRGEGLVDIKYTISENAVVGVQIQGKKFKLLVENKEDGSHLYGKAQKLANSKVWFNFTPLKKKNGKSEKDQIFPKKAEVKNEFNKYNNTFYYRYQKLDFEKLSVKDVVAIVGEYLEEIERNQKEIRRILT